MIQLQQILQSCNDMTKCRGKRYLKNAIDPTTVQYCSRTGTSLPRLSLTFIHDMTPPPSPFFTHRCISLQTGTVRSIWKTLKLTINGFHQIWVITDWNLLVTLNYLCWSFEKSHIEAVLQRSPNPAYLVWGGLCTMTDTGCLVLPVAAQIVSVLNNRDVWFLWTWANDCL